MWYRNYQTRGNTHNPSHLSLHQLMSPRVVTLVSTLDAQGLPNITSTSQCTVLAHDRVLLACDKQAMWVFLRDIQLTGELVINSVDSDMEGPMAASVVPRDPSRDEFNRLGLTEAGCELIGAPRVAESAWNLECELVSTHDHGDSTVVVARVLGTHVRDDLDTDTGLGLRNLFRVYTAGGQGHHQLGGGSSSKGPPPPSRTARARGGSHSANIKLLRRLGDRSPSAQWIRLHSALPWMELDLQVPVTEIMREWRQVADQATPWERGDRWRGMETRGWKSLTLHGMAQGRDHHDQQVTGAHNNTWMPVADLCPATKRFVEQNFQAQSLGGSSSLGTVRFLLIEPGGYIVPHRDRTKPGLMHCNIGIDVPDGTHFYMAGHGALPYRSGSCMILDHSNTHWVINDSDRPRLHMTVIADVNDDVLIRSYEVHKSKRNQRASSPGITPSNSLVNIVPFALIIIGLLLLNIIL